LTNFQVAGGATPQLWSVDFDGTFTGLATLTFNYDPAAVANPSLLSVLHFNESLNQWENLGGVVDAQNHTITVETSSFSPFVMVETVPEPSTLVLACFAALALAVVGRRSVARQLSSPRRI
jgi:hypothetical protein